MVLIRAKLRCLALGLAALVIAAQTPIVSSDSSSSLRVDVPLVVHVDASFSAVLMLPPSLAKKSSVEAEVSVVYADGGQDLLFKQKLLVSSGGEVLMQHELDGLQVG